MFSPVKIAHLAFFSFATLALAIPASEGRSKDLKALIYGTNIALNEAMLPLGPCNFPSRLCSVLDSHSLPLNSLYDP